MEAAADAGISAPLGPRLFRSSGGMPPTHLTPSSSALTGRFLSFREREEIAIELAQGTEIRAIVSLSAGLAFIASLAPENEVQAALAVQLAALHSASMNVLSRVPLVGDRSLTTMSSAGAKLARAFQSGLETYYRIKRGNSQTIRIERVTIEAGAQAVIGSVNGQ